MKQNCCALLIVYLAAGVGCSPDARDRPERQESVAPEAALRFLCRPTLERGILFSRRLGLLNDPPSLRSGLEVAGLPIPAARLIARLTLSDIWATEIRWRR